MSGIPSIGGLASLEFQAQRAAQAVKLQKEALDLQGDLAIQLIQSVADPGVGGGLDVRV